MSPVLEVPTLFLCQAEIGLVIKGSRLERMTWTFLPQVTVCNSALGRLLPLVYEELLRIPNR